MEQETSFVWAGIKDGQGYKDGPRGEAVFSHPRGIAVDDSGDVFVADPNNSCIRKISRRDEMVSTWCKEGIWYPVGIVCADGELFVSEHDGNGIERISRDGIPTLFAGNQQHKSGHRDGTLLEAEFSGPRGLVFNKDNQNLFVADSSNHLIRKISMQDGIVTTIVGEANSKLSLDGIGINARVSNPVGIACHQRTGDLYVVDTLKGHVRKISPVKDISGSVQWTVTSISILLDQPDTGNYFGVAIFCDMMFLTSWDSGYVIRSTLDGKEARVVGTLPNCMAIAVDSTGVYATQYYSCVIDKFPFSRWSPQTHQHFDREMRLLIKAVITASLSPFGTSQLRKLPRDIVFYMLTFLKSVTARRRSAK
jgi:DNA-binding beta-propeller fold protein YncE